MTGRVSQGWLLSIDFGTTATAGAMRDNGDGELVEIDNERRMPSMVCWKETSNGAPGRLLVGDEAENEAAFAPHCLERCPKRKLGQEFILLGSERVRVTDAIGQIFRHVVDEATTRQGERRPRELRLTHPARWGERRLNKLREAAAFVGFDEPPLLPEPVGAAVYFAEKELNPGDHVVVYDLGGGTFDTAVLERTTDGFRVIGKPGGREDLGGEDFDDLLYRYLGQQVDHEQWQILVSPDSDPMWLRAHYDFKNDVRRSKERLSRWPDAKVRTPIPGTPDLQVSAAEFEDLIGDKIEITVSELERTVTAAGKSLEELSAIYLAGGSSQIPLVARRIEETLGTRPRMLGDPKGVIALGATRAQIGPARTRDTSSPPRKPPSRPGTQTANDVSESVPPSGPDPASRPQPLETPPTSDQPRILAEARNPAELDALTGALQSRISDAAEQLARTERAQIRRGQPCMTIAPGYVVYSAVVTRDRPLRPLRTWLVSLDSDQNVITAAQAPRLTAPRSEPLPQPRLSSATGPQRPTSGEPASTPNTRQAAPSAKATGAPDIPPGPSQTQATVSRRAESLGLWGQHDWRRVGPVVGAGIGGCATGAVLGSLLSWPLVGDARPGSSRLVAGLAVLSAPIAIALILFVVLSRRAAFSAPLALASGILGVGLGSLTGLIQLNQLNVHLYYAVVFTIAGVGCGLSATLLRRQAIVILIGIGAGAVAGALGGLARPLTEGGDAAWLGANLVAFVVATAPLCLIIGLLPTHRAQEAVGEQAPETG